MTSHLRADILQTVLEIKPVQYVMHQSFLSRECLVLVKAKVKHMEVQAYCISVLESGAGICRLSGLSNGNNNTCQQGVWGCSSGRGPA